MRPRKIFAAASYIFKEIIGICLEYRGRRVVKDSRGYADTVAKIRKALEAAGVEFIDENGGGPGVRLR